ncbi:MAG: sensor histidine kinase [Schwartzia sp.]|nr:sensor histidine kinase [Schwartzia sp. (in: firmicutes)]
MAVRMQDELRRSFFLYTIVPLVVLFVLSAISFYWYWSGQVVGRNEEALDSAAKKITATIEGGMSAADSLAGECNLSRLMSDNVYYVEFYRRVHLSLDALPAYQMFAVLDKNQEVVMESHSTSKEMAAMPSFAYGGLVQRLNADPLHAVHDFTERESRFGRPQDVAVASAIVRDGEVRGYLVLVASGDEILRDIVHPRINFIVEDREGNTPLCTYYSFSQRLSNKIQPIFHEATGLVTYDTSDYYVAHRAMLGGDLTIYAVTLLGEMRGYLVQSVLIFVIALVTLSALSFFLSLHQARAETKNLLLIIDAFAAVERGDLNHHLDIDGPHELRVVGNSYNSMVESLKRLMRSNEEKTRAVVTMELSQLTSQFDPHFLYNTLSSIKFMITMRPEAAGEMTMALSRLLRYSIRQSTASVSIESDIEHLYDYLAIMQYRFGERFDYEINVDDDVRGALVPKLIMQPVIENSLKYGMEKMEHIEVTVFVTVENKKTFSSDDENVDVLVIKIRDTGGGIDDAALVGIRGSLAKKAPPDGHQGLYNVHRRITLLYGEDNGYGLTITSEDGVGATVTLRMPLVKGAQSVPV